MSLAVRLKESRERIGLTRAQVERRADIASGTLSKLETGERDNPTIGTLEKLAGALGVDSGWLTWGDATDAPGGDGDATDGPTEAA